MPFQQDKLGYNMHLWHINMRTNTEGYVVEVAGTTVIELQCECCATQECATCLSSVAVAIVSTGLSEF